MENQKTETPLITDITHRPFGGLDSWTYGNGLTQTLEHDLDGRITSVSVKNAKNEAVWQQAYEYDRLNNITGIERNEGENTYQQQFGYDVLQRLIKDQGPYGQQRFEYDEVGNRLSQRYARAEHQQEPTDGQPEEQLTKYYYAPASNRLVGTSEKDILRDQAGNTLQEDNHLQHTYDYNAQNRISAYQRDGELKARYNYNALGQRIHKAVVQPDGSEAHTLFYYDQQGQLLGETRVERTNATQRTQPIETQNLVWLQRRPVVAIDVEENEAPRIAWLHSDHLLTARAATDENQKLTWRWHSDAFGVGEAESLSQASEPKLTLNLRFPGQYRDEESGLYYNYFRTYDPSSARYTQSDPIGLAGGINTFNYASSTPLTFFDFLGLADCNDDTLAIPATWDPITDQRILTLHPRVRIPAAVFVNEVKAQLGITLRITQATRTIAEQDALYAKGRTVPGKKVTNAKGGYSYHNYGLAIDVAEILGKSVVWETDWEGVSRIGKEVGFAWGGDFSSIVDKPHFEMTFGLSISDLLKGETP